MNPTFVWCALVAMLLGWLAIGSEDALAQERPRPATLRERPRSRTNPGEVITRPDRSERWPDQIRVGEAAPDFTLPLLASQSQKPGRSSGESNTQQKTDSAAKQITLQELHAKKPAVLIFGSITCPPFRGQLEGVEKVYQQFQDRAEFLFVYIREAHPDSVLLVTDESQKQGLQKIPQATTLPGRTSSASVCQRSAKLTLPIAVDDIDNSVGKAYSGWPNRMVVVGTDGKIIYASPGAPGGTNAQRLIAWLSENLSGQ